MIKEYGYEYEAVLDEKLWARTKDQAAKKEFWGALCLRSGRDCLKAIAREYEPTVVLMPALACESMILPFEKCGHSICYYKLKEDYTIDLNDLSIKIPADYKRVIFLYMDYFGILSIKEHELEGLRKNYPNLLFVEDRTHNLIWRKKRKFRPEYTIASLRKWVNVPDGGLLWSEVPLKKNLFKKDNTFSEIRLEAQCMRSKYFQTEDENLKKKYRTIFSAVSEILDGNEDIFYMSLYSYEIICQTDWDAIREQRKRNAEQLIHILADKKVKLIQDKVGESDLYVPFMVDHRDQKQTLLSGMGIFNTVIWPLNRRQKEICSVAKYTEEHMLAAPCDQRYTKKDMIFVGTEMAGVLDG